MSELEVDALTDEQVLEKLVEYGERVETKERKLNEAQKQIHRKKLKHIEARKKMKREKAEKQSGNNRRKTIISKQAVSDEVLNIKSPNVNLLEPNNAVDDLNSTFVLSGDLQKHSQMLQISMSSPAKPINPKSPLALEVINSVTGCPFVGVEVSLYGLNRDGMWLQLAERITDESGMCPNIITRDLFTSGSYKINVNIAKCFGDASSTLKSIEIALNILAHKSYSVKPTISQAIVH
ncbi:hypothetical protein HELRODRAFT_162444 [Helobdella robusta]|uniref:Transthyretin/hydroxyisourate hydrolase domain-containing protein n=1 Tax=Helobdella robusta TaxID=6412 RepID=T1ESN7_HELRO|nr:hypothetical protein HELRODRAFT_162444 [Helobdella robusta]ESN98971.1 hypothetical protein HELRODRAFT_162444 [Helobdella robusta]